MAVLAGSVERGEGRGGETCFAVPHEEVGHLLEQRGVPVVQVRACGDWQLGEREFGAGWERRGGGGFHGDFCGGLSGQAEGWWAGGWHAGEGQLGGRGRDV